LFRQEVLRHTIQVSPAVGRFGSKRAAAFAIRSFPMTARAQIGDETRQSSRYRVYWLGGDDRIDGAEVIQSHDYGGAIATARGMTDGRTVELWDRGRFIGRFEPAVHAGGGRTGGDRGRPVPPKRSGGADAPASVETGAEF
jgi:hypothetical protein